MIFVFILRGSVTRGTVTKRVTAGDRLALRPCGRRSVDLSAVQFFKPSPVDGRGGSQHGPLFLTSLRSLPSPALGAVSACVLFAVYVSDRENDALFVVLFLTYWQQFADPLISQWTEPAWRSRTHEQAAAAWSVDSRPTPCVTPGSGGRSPARRRHPR